MQRREDKLSVSKRRPSLTAEAAMPANRSRFVPMGLTIQQQQAERKRFRQRNARKFSGRGERDGGVRCAMARLSLAYDET